MSDIRFTELDVPDLLERIEALFKRQMDNFRLELLYQAKQPEDIDYLTRKEVAALFKVSVQTIINWEGCGILVPYKIGNKIRYKLAEVKQALNQA